MSCGGSGRLDGVREVGLMLLSHCSGRPLLGGFFGDSGFHFGGSWSNFVLGVGENFVELSVSQAVTWAGLTEVRKLVAFLHFFALLLKRKFFGPFSCDVLLLRQGSKAWDYIGMFRLQS